MNSRGNFLKSSQAAGAPLESLPTAHSYYDTILAVDCSGSTSNRPGYFLRLREIWQSLVLETKQNLGILLWNHKCPYVPNLRHAKQTEAFLTTTQFKIYLKARAGKGGTCTVSLAKHIKHLDFHGSLILVTDGLVAHHTVEQTDAVLSAWPFSSVLVHLIGTPRECNLSVPGPFLRASPGRVEFFNVETQAQTVEFEIHAETIALLEDLDRIETVDAYKAVQRRLEDAVRMRTVGASAAPRQLRERLLALQTRLLRQYERALGHTSRSTVQRYHDALAAKDAQEACETMTTLVQNAFGIVRVDWQKSFERMLAMCTEEARKSMSLTQNYERAERTVPQTMEDLVTGDSEAEEPGACESGADEGAVATHPRSAASFLCDISLEHGTVALLLTHDDGEASSSLFARLAETLDRPALAKMTANPLSAYRSETVRDALVAMLDHPVSVATLKEGDATLARSHMTRKPRRPGALTLGTDAAHAAMTDWTLAQALNGGRMPGSADLWFAVIVMLVEEDPRLAYLRERDGVLPALHAHMRWRLEHRTSRLWLSGLSNAVPTRVRLGAAVWAVLASPIVTDVPLRMHLLYWPVLARLATIDDALPDLPPSCPVHAERLSVMTMMQRMKATQRAHVIEQGVRALRGSAVFVNLEHVGEDVKAAYPALYVTPWVPQDGTVQVTQDRIRQVGRSLNWPSVLCDAPYDVLVEMDALTAPSRSAGSILVPFLADQQTFACNDGAVQHHASSVLWPIMKEVLEENEKEKGDDGDASLYGRVTIHPLTCRPLYFPRDNDDSRTWKEDAACVWKGEFVAMNEYFGRFCERFMRYPSREDMTIYLYATLSAKEQVKKRMERAGVSVASLPFRTVWQLINCLFEDYKLVVSKMEPAEFVKRFVASRPVSERCALERSQSVADALEML